MVPERADILAGKGWHFFNKKDKSSGRGGKWTLKAEARKDAEKEVWTGSKSFYVCELGKKEWRKRLAEKLWDDQRL